MANTATSLYVPTGNSNYIELDFNPNVDLNTTAWTIEFWVYNPSGYFFSGYTGGDAHNIYITSSETIQFYLNHGVVS